MSERGVPRPDDASSPDGLPRGPVLLIGAGGMLGRAWAALLKSQGIECIAPDRETLDLLQPRSIRRVLDESCPIVVNCAAWTDVDGAEGDESGARDLNATAVGALAARCREVGATLVHYSTDYVFDGQADQPYQFDAPRRPIGAYGRTKAEGEILIEESGAPALIIRTSWLYAPWGKNFVRTIAAASRQRDVLRVVNDQRGRPTSCEHLASVSAALAASEATGVYHVCDGGECTWYDFACEIVRLVGSGCRVEPCSSDEFPRPAPRPAYSVLDLTETEARIGPMPDWRQNLASVIPRMEA